MKLELNDFEYNDLVEDILANKEFRKLENFIHHKTDRLEHSKRVSLYSYKICKMLKLDYVSAARGGLLHDFFFDKYQGKSSTSLMKNHPKIALRNAKKYFKINKIEANIIESHMYPLNIRCKPKYAESYVVSTIDKISCLYEKSIGYTNEICFKVGKRAIYMFLFLFS